MNPTRIAFLIATTAILATTLSAQTFVVLHNFELTDGQNPQGMLANDSTGKLYGTTEFGGNVNNESEGNGVLFQLTNVNGAWRESVLHKFSDGDDGGDPEAGLIAGPAGNGYGTAPFGGSFTQTICNFDGGCGTVYRMGSNGKFSVVYSFTGTPDGEHPFSALLAGASGMLYGTTELGGNLDCPFNSDGCGTVYQVNANGAEQVIYSFLGPNNNSDGANPFSALVKDAAGNLYGSTVFGGTINNNDCEPDTGCGTVFELTPSNDGSWTETVLYRFQGAADGSVPAVSFFNDANGSIYGTTSNGGNVSECGDGCGTIFKLTKTNGQWTKTTLYAFHGADGDSPISPLTHDAAGNLYGATTYGGNLNCTYYQPGCGVVFKVSPNGKETVLHKFSGTDGLFPAGGVLLYRDALYGTTIEGGDIANCSLPHYYDGCGVVFQISK